MTKKIKVLAIPTLLLVTGLASCNTLNSTSGTSGKTISYEEAYKHVVKNHDPHLNDGLFATYTVTINDLSVTNLGTFEKNTKTGEMDVINDISVSLSNISASVDLPYTIAVGSKLFATYGGYLNAPAAFTLLGVGAQVDYGFTLNNGCLGYYLETNMLTPAINAAGGFLQMLIGKNTDTKEAFVLGKSQSASTYLSMIQNVSVGDTTVGLYLNFTDFGFIDSIRVKLNISDLFAPLDVSVLDDPNLIAIFGSIVGDAFEIDNLTLDVTLSAQYK